MRNFAIIVATVNIAMSIDLVLFHNVTCYTNSLLSLHNSFVSRALWLPQE